MCSWFWPPLTVCFPWGPRLVRWLNRAPLLCCSGGQCYRSHTHSTHFNLSPLLHPSFQLSKSAGITHCMVHTIRNYSNSNDVSKRQNNCLTKYSKTVTFPPPFTSRHKANQSGLVILQLWHAFCDEPRNGEAACWHHTLADWAWH